VAQSPTVPAGAMRPDSGVAGERRQQDVQLVLLFDRVLARQRETGDGESAGDARGRADVGDAPAARLEGARLRMTKPVSMSNMFVSRAIHGALAVLAGGVIALTASAAATAGELTAKQAASLDALGIRVAVPTYVPPGFALEEVKTTPCATRVRRGSSGTCSGGPDYFVRYHKGSSWFAMEGTGGGIGGTSLTYKTPVTTKAFGKVDLRFGAGPDGVGFAPSAAQMHAVQNELYCDWLGSGPFYHLIGERIAPDVMSKVLASVVWLPGGR